MNSALVETKIKIKGSDYIIKSVPLGYNIIDIVVTNYPEFKLVIVPIRGYWKRLLNIAGHISLYGIRIYKLNIQWKNYARINGEPKYFFKAYITKR